jgi:hypothetical protein
MKRDGEGEKTSGETYARGRCKSTDRKGNRTRIGRAAAGDMDFWIDAAGGGEPR